MTELLAPCSWSAVVRTVAQAPALFCFLDYDGTLAPIASRPEATWPLPGTTEVLACLTKLPKVQVAVVSGRRADDVSRFVPAPGLYFVGFHGAEILWPDHLRTLLEGVERIVPWVRQARHQLERAIRGLDGVWVKDKHYALACHVRLAAEASRLAAAEAVRKIYAHLSAQGAPLEFIEGHRVYELRMLGLHKGGAAMHLLATFEADALPLYTGAMRQTKTRFELCPQSRDNSGLR